MRVFILEDDPNRVEGFMSALEGHEVDHAIDVKDAIRKWKPPYDVVLLDHDLGGEHWVNSKEPNTGYQFAKWMARQHKGAPMDPQVIVHSWNPEGGISMLNELSEAGLRVFREPFGRNLLRWLGRL